MPDPLRILTGFALVVFLVTAGLGVYAFLALQPGTQWRGKAIWFFGAAIVGASIMTVAVTIFIALAKWLEL